VGVYNWVRGVLQTMCSVVVAVFGFLLVGQNLSAAMAGFVLSYAVQVSQGEQKDEAWPRADIGH
jgi:quinol-cytochrome oxidoreductase complex cytochrome b subunit